MDRIGKGFRNLGNGTRKAAKALMVGLALLVVGHQSATAVEQLSIDLPSPVAIGTKSAAAANALEVIKNPLFTNSQKDEAVSSLYDPFKSDLNNVATKARKISKTGTGQIAVIDVTAPAIFEPLYEENEFGRRIVRISRTMHGKNGTVHARYGVVAEPVENASVIVVQDRTALNKAFAEMQNIANATHQPVVRRIDTFDSENFQDRIGWSYKRVDSVWQINAAVLAYSKGREDIAVVPWTTFNTGYPSQTGYYVQIDPKSVKGGKSSSK